MSQTKRYTGGEVLPSRGAVAREQWTPADRRAGLPDRAAFCKPGDVRFVHREINLPGGASPAEGVVIASIEPQGGLTYEGVWVRWGCPHEWLIRTGVIEITILSRERTPYPLAETFQNPGEPIWLPWCEQLGNRLEVRATWTDPLLTAFTQIPVWAEFALGTSAPPSFDDANDNRVRRRIADIVPVTVAPGTPFVGISAGIIRPTAGKIWLQVSPAVGPAIGGQPQFSFATVRGIGVAANIAGSVPAQALGKFVEIEQDDVRDVFLGDPLGSLAAPVDVDVHREVWA